MVNKFIMRDKNGIYYNEFFEGREPKLTFNDNPRVLSNLTVNDIWKDQAKFYFLPFLIHCYKFTRQHKLPYFALMVSPTMMFYRDRLHLRHFMSSIHKVFFDSMEMCGLLDERILLLVEKRFHIKNPIDGGSQQLYNMLWDVDLNPNAEKCKVIVQANDLLDQNWNNPSMVQKDDLWLSRGTLWFQDDLQFLSRRFTLDSQYSQVEDQNGKIVRRDNEQVDSTLGFPVFQDCSLYGHDQDRLGEFHATEVLDLTNVLEYKKDLYKPREFYFKVFEPIPIDEPEESEEDENDSTDSDLIDDFDDIDSTGGMVDSTLDFEEDDEEMKKIIAFFANMPKVTGLVQGMLDMITSLTRILPLVVTKLDNPEEEKLKKALERTLGVLNIGIDKILKLCRFLGIKVERKPSGAVQVIVKDRFKQNKKDFIDYEIDELNKTIDALENVDENEKPMCPIHPGDIPPDLTPNNLYPQVMPLGHHHCHPHRDPVHEFLSQGHDKEPEKK